MKRLFAWYAVVFFLLGAPAAEAQDVAESVFDPERHMRVSEVRTGMRGYGLTVFRGTKIERFDVEVVGVLHNFNPKRDVILIRCDNDYLKHTGPIAGMSGSPIYLMDENGKSRMVGAFAYGWPLMKDPIAGVQPVEYMLDLRPPRKPVGEDVGAKNASPAGDGAGQVKPSGTVQWKLTDVAPLPGSNSPAPRTWPLATWGTLQPNPLLGGRMDGERMSLRPLATPVMTAGISPELLEKLSGLFNQYGVVALQAGGAGRDAAADADAAEVKLEPGSVLAIPILTGDVDMTAVGTTTEVVGQNVYGFGHPFFNEGPVQWPMGTGYVTEVIANLMTSFKLGSLLETRGTLFADEISGVAGRVGAIAQTIPIDLAVVYADGSVDTKYHFDAAAHPRFTPMVAAMAIMSAASSARELPQYHTLNYDVTLEFANGQTIRIQNTAVNEGAEGMFSDIVLPVVAAAENPFESVMMKRASGTITVVGEAREADILSVNVPRLKYRPGETVRAYVAYRPFRSAEGIMEVQMELPRDLAEGKYALSVADWRHYIQEEASMTPFRFTAESSEQLFDVVREVTGIRRDALYVRLVRQADGVAIGRTALPQLPSSRRQVLLDAGRSNTTPFISSTVKTIPTDWVMSGAAAFEITVDKDAKVETPNAPAPRNEPETPSPKDKDKEAPQKPRPAVKPDAAETEQ